MGNPRRDEEGGLEALHRLKSTEPPLYLSPSTDLSQSARTASQYIFSALLPSCPRSPLDRLHIDGFDAEQIWHQILLQSQPLISNLRREIKQFERSPPQISSLFLAESEEQKNEGLAKEDGETEGREEEDGESSEEEFGGISEGEEEEEDEQEEEEEEGDGGAGGIEDRFLKIKELEEYLENDEEREYGLSKDNGGALSGSEEEEEEDDDEVSDSLIFVNGRDCGLLEVRSVSRAEFCK